MTCKDQPQTSSRQGSIELCSFEELVRPFGFAAPPYGFVSESEMPEGPAALLAHRRHMTVTLEKRFDSALRLEVLTAQHDEPHYSRCIRLLSRRSGELGLFGIMRFDFRSCSEQTRAEILEGNRPLGRILIASGALRTVHLHRLVRIDDAARALERFSTADFAVSDEGSEAAPLYGRLASIHCDGAPAVDLVEILSPELSR